jgi:hypothetical protein
VDPGPEVNAYRRKGGFQNLGVFNKDVKRIDNIMKNLIYYVIGGSVEYSQLLELSIKSVRAYKENDEYDILVMCDADYSKSISHLPVKFRITEKNYTPVQASIRKVDIFSYEHIDEYDNIMYIDCDTVITGSLKPIFDTITPGHLHVFNEYTCSFGHEYVYYSRPDKPYSQETLSMFEANNISVFNCGQFCFQNCDSVKEHFNAIWSDMCQTWNSNVHFYEQSHMNEYFNTRNLARPTMRGLVELIHMGGNSQPKKEYIINHFCNSGIHFSVKLQRMKEFFETLCY